MKTESRLQQDCFMWHWNTFPNHRGRFFMCHNTPKNAIDGNRLKGMGLLAGVSDMILLRDGRPPLCIEFKTEEGRQSERQKWWQKVAESTGAEYAIIKTLEEFQELFTDIMRDVARIIQP